MSDTQPQAAAAHADENKIAPTARDISRLARELFRELPGRVPRIARADLARPASRRLDAVIRRSKHQLTVAPSRPAGTTPRTKEHAP
jgi:hypothetical protein